ncbi:MAG: hypothetical protein J6D21_00670 [Clostridia bacterium]|nr:hypothetical protein [Clostridia bacterium]
MILLLVVNFVLCADYATKGTYVSPEKQEFLDAIFTLYRTDPEQFWVEYQRAIDAEEAGEFPATPYGNGNYFATNNFEDVLPIVQADSNYHQQLTDIIRQSENMVPTYLLMGVSENDYRVRYQKKVSEIYTRLNAAVTLDDVGAVGWEQYFTYESEYYPAMIVMLAICVMIALNDRRIGFYPIASTCRHGRGSTIVAKLLAAVSASAVVAALFSGVTLLSVGMSIGLSSPHVPVQTLESMRLCPYAITIGGAALLSLCLKLLAAVLFAAIVFVVSMLLKNMLLGYVAGAGVIMVPLFLQALEVVDVGQWKYLNLFSVYVPSEFVGRYRSVNLFSFPVSLVYFFIVMTFVLAIVALLVSCAVCHTRGIPFSALSRRIRARMVELRGERVKKVSGRSLSLMAHEAYKCRILYVVLAVLLLVSAHQSKDYYSSYVESASERNYKAYLTEIGGPYTEEKYQSLLSDERECRDIVNLYDTMEERYANDEITEREFNKYLKQYSTASGKLNGLHLLLPSARHLYKLASQGIIGSFVYETGYNWYRSRGVDWLLILFVALFSCYFYLIENEFSANGSAAIVLVRTAPKGRLVLLWRKLTLCLGTVTLAWCAFSAIDFWYFSATMELPALHEPLVSLSLYEGAPVNLTIATYTVLTELASLVGVWILSVLCFFIAFLVKRPVYTYAIVTVLLVVPHFASATGVGIASRVDLTMLQNTDALFRYSLTEHCSPVWFVTFLSAAAVLTLVLALVCSHRIRKGGKA